jgi:hypothetical protein
MKVEPSSLLSLPYLQADEALLTVDEEFKAYAMYVTLLEESTERGIRTLAHYVRIHSFRGSKR